MSKFSNRRREFLSGGLALIASPALAQRRSSLLSENTTGKHILVIGDSNAVGLGLALSRLLSPERGASIDSRGIVNTGLARADARMQNFSNWPAETTRLLNAPSRPHYAAAVLMLGGVDNQRLTFSDGRESVAFGTPDFAIAYAERMTALTALLRDKQIPALWVGLPSVGPAEINQAYAWLDQVQIEAAQRGNFPFFSIRALTLNNGAYDDRHFDRRDYPHSLRMPDAIHFTATGYLRLGELVIPRIEALIGGRRLTRR